MKNFIYSCLVSKRRELIFFYLIFFRSIVGLSFENPNPMFPRYAIENLNVGFAENPDEYFYLNQKANLFNHKKGNISFDLKYYKNSYSATPIINQENITLKYFILSSDSGFDLSKIRNYSDKTSKDSFPWKKLDLRWNGESTQGIILRNKFTTYIDLETAFAETPYLSTRNLLVVYIEGLENRAPLMFAAPINMIKNTTNLIEIVHNSEDVSKILNYKVAKKNLEYYEKSIFDFSKDYKSFWKKIGHETYELTNSYFDGLGLGIAAKDFANFTTVPPYDVYKKLCKLFYSYGEKKSICESNATSVIDISRFDIIYNIPNTNGKNVPQIYPTSFGGNISIASGKTTERNKSIMNLTSRYANLSVGASGQIGIAGPSDVGFLGGSVSASGGVGISYNYLDNNLNYSTDYDSTEIYQKSDIEYLEIKANFIADVVSCFAIRSIPYVQPGRNVVSVGTAPVFYQSDDIRLDTKAVHYFCLPKKMNMKVSENYYYLKELRTPTDSQISGDNLEDMGTFTAIRGLGIFKKYIEIAQSKTVKWSTEVTASEYAKELSEMLGLGKGNEFYKFYHYPGVIKRF